MKAIQAVLVALVATIILTSVAAAGPDAAKQRVAIDMKIYSPGNEDVRAHAAAGRRAEGRLGHDQQQLDEHPRTRA